MLKLKLGNIIHLHGGVDALNGKEESSASGPCIVITLWVSDRVWTMAEKDVPTSHLLLFHLHLILQNESNRVDPLQPDGHHRFSPFSLCVMLPRQTVERKAPDPWFYLLCDSVLPYLQSFWDFSPFSCFLRNWIVTGGRSPWQQYKLMPSQFYFCDTARPFSLFQGYQSILKQSKF